VESAGEILRAIQSYAYADSDTDATRGKMFTDAEAAPGASASAYYTMTAL
jgi:hypothetical protein